MEGRAPSPGNVSLGHFRNLMPHALARLRLARTQASELHAIPKR
jgi:hypothetical protein